MYEVIQEFSQLEPITIIFILMCICLVPITFIVCLFIVSWIIVFILVILASIGTVLFFAWLSLGDWWYNLQGKRNRLREPMRHRRLTDKDCGRIHNRRASDFEYPKHNRRASDQVDVSLHKDDKIE